jgi:NitT/TauT family transport system permease protein
LALGWYPAANQVVNPVMQILRPISPIAWIPVAIIFFGIGDNAAIFLIFLGSFFPIVVACINGVANVPSVFRRAGRNFGLNPFQILTKVVFPAALPQILVGLRIALGIAWLVVVAAEMIAVDSGLGYLVIDSRNSGKRYDLVVAAMLLIGVIGLVLDMGFRRLEKIRSIRWGFRK